MNWQQDNEELLLEDAVDTGTGTLAEILVYNDDVNTFDWVIQCLVDILDHTPEQAEQLSLLIHFKGKATVKTGPKPDLLPKKNALLDRGLSAVLEEKG